MSNKVNPDWEGGEESRLKNSLASVLKPIDYFIRDQKSASILLLVCTIAALLISNSRFSDTYNSIIEMPLGLTLGNATFALSLKHWINDGFMALFFFVIGLEIKREFLAGKLKHFEHSLPVIAAAIGGMIVPGSLFVWINFAESTLDGWAIPMATDTAFALGVLALLGARVPHGLFAFLLALAIIDDMAAVLIIALFYSSDINMVYLSFAVMALLFLGIANSAGVRHPLVYFAGGFLVWLALYNSGVHTTLAGVLVALTVPAKPLNSPDTFLKRTRRLLSLFRDSVKKSNKENPVLEETESHVLVEKIQDTATKAVTPLRLWERTLEHPVALLVLPLFALVNAGVPIQLSELTTTLATPLSLGIIFGLVVGKSLGISLATLVIIRLGVGRLPDQMNFSHVIGVGLLAGMGFTMSVFIANLGFSDSPDTLIIAKSGILCASLIAGLAGYLWLLLTSKLDYR